MQRCPPSEDVCGEVDERRDMKPGGHLGPRDALGAMVDCSYGRHRIHGLILGLGPGAWVTRIEISADKRFKRGFGAMAREVIA